LIVHVDTFGPTLRDLRTAAGLSLADVAARTGLEQSAIGRIERGERSPTLRTLAALTVAVGFRFAVYGESVALTRDEEGFATQTRRR